MFGKILKLPPVRDCFTLAMTNKLVVIVNSLKVPKIKNILLCEMKFLVPNYSCPPEPLTRWATAPHIPVLSVRCPQLNLLNPFPNKIPGYATAEVSNRVNLMFENPKVNDNVKKNYHFCHEIISDIKWIVLWLVLQKILFLLSLPRHCSSSSGMRYGNSYSLMSFVVTVFPPVYRIFLIQ